MKITKVEQTKLDGISFIITDVYKHMPYKAEFAKEGEEFDFRYVPDIMDFIALIKKE